MTIVQRSSVATISNRAEFELPSGARAWRALFLYLPTKACALQTQQVRLYFRSAATLRWLTVTDEQTLEKQLRAEGFSETYVWQDSPNAFYPDHMHPSETAHVILAGEMKVTMQGVTRTYRAGERFDIPAKAVHSARMGCSGCRYLIGEK